jgi:hypothetical protein
MLDRLSLREATDALGEPNKSGKQIASKVNAAGAREGISGPSVLLGPEGWYIWDCAGVWTEFEAFQQVVSDAAGRSTETAPQLWGALSMLQRLRDDLFCVAIQVAESDAAEGKVSADQMVTIVNRCARHRAT